MLTEQIQDAMRQAVYELLPDDEGFYGEIPAWSGVWANASTLEACRNDLRKALEGWVVFGLRLSHSLPILNGIDLNTALHPTPYCKAKVESARLAKPTIPYRSSKADL